MMTVYIHEGDLPPQFPDFKEIAIDTETMGLNPHRDRLCLVQLSGGDGHAHLVKFSHNASRPFHAPNLVRLLSSRDVLKIFHFARFDLAALKHYLGVDCKPVYCTKIASRLIRTYTDKHGLKELCRELLSVDLSKQQQSSDWGANKLTKEQIQYAAADVLHLIGLKSRLNELLIREGRQHVAQACFDFLPTRAHLDIMGWPEQDIFAH